MRESELAQLLLSMAADQGIPMPAAAEEIAAIAFPAWVDAARVRSALVTQIEVRMRQQLENELETLRQRMLSAASLRGSAEPAPSVSPVTPPMQSSPAPMTAAAVSPAPSPAVAPSYQTPPPPPPADTPTPVHLTATMPPIDPAETYIPEAAPPPARIGRPDAPIIPEAQLPPNTLPPDATIVWTTQHGRPTDEE
ncbi:MAG: hypothetical protein DCC58_17875 [Chloroflexi bacterium]|nr:MAG: hypothetical protein DCC58_17875 [Chloroflexota bacterium]